MSDPYENLSTSLVSPASGAFAVTKSDSAELATIPRALYIGLGGDLVLDMHWGGTVTLVNVPSASLLPLRVKRVRTASTAGDIVGLY